MLYTNDGIFTVGLTGMSGAGKTTACSVFAEYGFAVIDCDTVAREVVGAGKPALDMIAAHFTKSVLCPDGTLDRRRLGGIVFTDSAELKALNGIIYPFITYDIIKRIVRHAENGSNAVLLDAPTLFESGADSLCDTVVCVTADREFCVQRIMRRDGLTREQALNRLSSQNDAGFYTERSQYSVVNGGTLGELEGVLRAVASELRDKAEETI